jgi:hypothetical protein
MGGGRGWGWGVEAAEGVELRVDVGLVLFGCRLCKGRGGFSVFEGWGWGRAASAASEGGCGPDSAHSAQARAEAVRPPPTRPRLNPYNTVESHCLRFLLIIVGRNGSGTYYFWLKTDRLIKYFKPKEAQTGLKLDSTKCPNPGVALIWATPLPPLHFTPHEHLASHGRAHRCMRSMPREIWSIARLARTQSEYYQFLV